jgi:hypothetical protein
MAVAVISGTANDRGTTNNVDAQRLVIDMRDEIQLLEPSDAPPGHDDADASRLRDAEREERTKIEWPESEDHPRDHRRVRVVHERR